MSVPTALKPRIMRIHQWEQYRQNSWVFSPVKLTLVILHTNIQKLCQTNKLFLKRAGSQIRTGVSIRNCGTNAVESAAVPFRHLSRGKESNLRLFVMSEIASKLLQDSLSRILFCFLHATVAPPRNIIPHFRWRIAHATLPISSNYELVNGLVASARFLMYTHLGAGGRI